MIKLFWGLADDSLLQNYFSPSAFLELHDPLLSQTTLKASVGPRVGGACGVYRVPLAEEPPPRTQVVPWGPEQFCSCSAGSGSWDLGGRQVLRRSLGPASLPSRKERWCRRSGSEDKRDEKARRGAQGVIGAQPLPVSTARGAVEAEGDLSRREAGSHPGDGQGLAVGPRRAAQGRTRTGPVSVAILIPAQGGTAPRRAGAGSDIAGRAGAADGRALRGGPACQPVPPASRGRSPAQALLPGPCHV